MLHSSCQKKAPAWFSQRRLSRTHPPSTRAPYQLNYDFSDFTSNKSLKDSIMTEMERDQHTQTEDHVNPITS
jgi:hypothetical protein